MDGVVETATNEVKKVVQKSNRFFSSVIKTTKIVAQQCIEEAKKIGRSIVQKVSSIGNQLSGWIFSWFGQSEYSY